MPYLERFSLNLGTAESELVTFREWMRRNTLFKETAIVAEIRARPHLACLIGLLMPGMAKPDVYKHEFEVQGIFRADLVVGNQGQRKFVLVEFEGGDTNSLFGPKRTKQYRYWSSELEHGFSQLVDWAWSKSDNGQSSIFQNTFECNDFCDLFVVVCGRDSTLNPMERKRFEWRSDKVSLAGTTSLILTYDDLLLHFESTLEALKSYL
ncbi:MAG: DUF4263 domain-containing protein [Azospirillum sp.]|nr:DUF4263 domain-containing protein [Azospirillum sp.]